jgi:hypothetical protein
MNPNPAAVMGRCPALSTLHERRVDPEWLDQLPADDPRAVRSRRDLALLNGLMGNAGLLSRELETACARPPESLLELGAGDGELFLRVARRLASRWKSVEACLLDRLPAVRPETRRGLERLGWRAREVRMDVFDWLRAPSPDPPQVTFANLFLHHFTNAELGRLLAAIADRTRVFVAVEPRRSARALRFSRLVWMIGCNAVTRHDARVSVRAGFAANELSRLWPPSGAWALAEGPAGWFSHLFVARRVAPGPECPP